MLTYDGDEAGQRAAKRAIPMLEKAGIKVKVLQMKDAKDPDEFLHKFGPDKFRMLLEESSNRVEYQLNAIRKKYDLGEDDQRVQFIHEAAELISSLTSAVQREIYGHRIAQAGGISFEAMNLEISKAYKRRIARQKKQHEKIDLAPAQSLQPKARSIRYDNMKSAMAEEGLLALVLKDPSLLELTKSLQAGQFSSALLGRVYAQLQQRYTQDMEVSLSVLEDFSPEEMSHLAGISQRQQGPVSEAALKDCMAVILKTSQVKTIESNDDLMAFRNKLKESKGTK